MKHTLLLVIFSIVGQLSFLRARDPPTSDCQDTLKNMIEELKNFPLDPNITEVSKYTKGFAALSGRFLNDFGEYDLCQNFTASYYLTLRFTANISKSSFDAMIGYCSPKNCTIQESVDNIDLVYEAYKHGMAFPLANISDSKTASFYDPKSVPPGDKPTTIIIFTIVALVVLCVVAGTALGVYWEVAEERRQKNKASERLLRESADPSSADLTSENINRLDSPSVVPVAGPKRELKGIFKFLDCFDARKNFDKIVKVKYTDSYDFNLEVFNGIRVFMMLYVVYGHTFLFGTNYIDNVSDIPTITNDWGLLVPNAALYAVDVFFYMSGFLFAYIGLGKLKKMKPNLLNYVGLGFHRFLRIWPTYAFAVIFFWRVLPYLGEGPMWFKMTYYTQLCEGNAWKNLVLLDDFLVDSADYCFGWGWYLSNDFQMFMITPIFLWIYIRNRRAGKLGMVALMAVSYILALVIGAELNVRGTPPKAGGVTNGKGFSQYYVKPYIRLPPYLIGVLAALMYKEYKEQVGSSFRIFNNIKQSRLLRNLVPISGAILLLVLTFLPRQVQLDDKAWPDWFHNTWRAFQKSFYVVALTMVLLPSFLGESTIFKRFLSHPLLVPLARLSFTAYLVHLFWVYFNFFNASASYHFTFKNVTLNTIANGVVAFLAGFALSLLMEVPMANIEAKYLGGGRSSKPKPKLVNNNGTITTGTESSIIPIPSAKDV